MKFRDKVDGSVFATTRMLRYFSFKAETNPTISKGGLFVYFFIFMQKIISFNLYWKM